MGAPIAIKAMAAKLARLVYRMLRYRMTYVDQGAVFYERIPNRASPCCLKAGVSGEKSALLYRLPEWTGAPDSTARRDSLAGCKVKASNGEAETF